MKRPDSISLEDIQDEPLRFAFELPLPAASLDREPLLEITPVTFEGTVSPMEGGFSLDGRIRYGGRLECSRCVTAYPFREDEHFSLSLYPRVSPAPDEVALEKSDLDAYFYDEPVLAVAPIVEERIQLAIPMKPLCRPDCRGICPECGTDRNTSQCDCAPEAGDPRWEALKVLRAPSEAPNSSHKVDKKV
jgi:uncharacterized protein